MTTPHLIIIGGGLTGMSAGCYALRNGFRVTLIEHNQTLGGVCTAWKRGDYTIDGSIHWLTGGPFTRLYEELKILERAPARTLTQYVRYRGPNVPTIDVTRDLDNWLGELSLHFPEDGDELVRLRDAARSIADLDMGIDAPELFSVRDSLRRLWEGRDSMGVMMHYRKPMREWVDGAFKSKTARRIFSSLVPADAPALFLVMVLGYLEKGYLSRPVGGTAAFKGALEHTYRSEGGEVLMPATVDEILVKDGNAHGVRLSNGAMLFGDYVISTASSPETVMRLLGGRYEPGPTQKRLEQWKLFDPIVLISLGLDIPLQGEPGLQVIDHIEPLHVGSKVNDKLYVRICNDEASFAPLGHSVLQVTLTTDYDWWATRGSGYEDAKSHAAHVAIDALAAHFPRLASHVQMIDVATPLTFWSMARSWRGAFEGWMPSPDAMFEHPKKRLNGLAKFIMAGQWLEPGGGVPVAIMSGRQAVQLLCREADRRFVPVRT